VGLQKFSESVLLIISPANPDDRLLQLDNFVPTPHIAGGARESANIAAEVITKNTDKIAQGKSPLTAVNSF
jgi:D-3-phosphoglycerate dehydrogenase / 2-oxoglutarate reductase